MIRKIVDPIVKTGGVDQPFFEREGVTLVEVHSNHLADHWFGTWSAQYERTPPPGSFLQIVPPGHWFCECHQHSVPHFELPGPIHSGNRAARRRRGPPEFGMLATLDPRSTLT